jgi:cobalt-zinc-cadmium efflux system membrane fusion protein
MDARKPVEPEADSARAYFEETRERPRRSMLRLAILLSIVVALVAAVAIWPQPVRDLAEKVVGIAQGMMPGKHEAKEEAGATPDGKTANAGDRVFRPTKEQRSALEIKPVVAGTFRPEYAAEGRIAVNEDDNVPVTSPYSGRVTKVLVRAGEDVKPGQVLLTIEASDMVQAQNDYQGALNTLNKAQALFKLEQTIAQRQQELFQARATALKDYESAQNDVIAAQSDLKTGEASLQAVRNRLMLLGKTDAEITAFEKSGKMSAETEIRAPIAGTIVQRKVGVGQYISSSGDPLFVIGDLSTVWLVANVRESEVPRVRIGQDIDARIVGFPRTVFRAKISYIATSLDPATRRLGVRAELDNPDRALKPEMFANFTITTGGDRFSPSVPSAAVVYEGDKAHVWVSRPDGAVEARDVKLGLTNGDNVQVVEGLKTGEEVVTRGAIFIDRAASGNSAS